jgi:hypothetical protein
MVSLAKMYQFLSPLLTSTLFLGAIMYGMVWYWYWYWYGMV